MAFDDVVDRHEAVEQFVLLRGRGSGTGGHSVPMSRRHTLRTSWPRGQPRQKTIERSSEETSGSS